MRFRSFYDRREEWAEGGRLAARRGGMGAAAPPPMANGWGGHAEATRGARACGQCLPPTPPRPGG